MKLHSIVATLVFVFLEVFGSRTSREEIELVLNNHGAVW
jgi:hypothetical protein